MLWVLALLESRLPRHFRKARSSEEPDEPMDEVQPQGSVLHCPMAASSGAAGVWFRKCLRLHDNEALVKACAFSEVVPFFILDPHFNRSAVGVNRFAFLLQSLQDGDLDAQLRLRGSRLLVFQGRPHEVLADLFNGKAGVRLSRLYFEKDTEPYARSRDVQVECLAKEHRVSIESFSGHTLLDIDATVANPKFKPPISMKSMQSDLGQQVFAECKSCQRAAQRGHLPTCF
eukprot:g29027.t1